MNPIFETARLAARPLTLDDVEAMHTVFGDPVVSRFIAKQNSVDLDATRAIVERLIGRYAERPGFGWWALVRRDTGAFLGTVCLQPMPDEVEIEVGYSLRRDAWGQGYATEAALGALWYAFERLGLEYVVATVRPENGASIRVLEKCGLRHVGRIEYKGHNVLKLHIDRPVRVDRE